MSAFPRITLLFSLISIMLLSACNSTVKVEELERLKLELSAPEPIKLERLKFKVIVLDDGTYFALSEKDYESFSINVNRIQNYLQLQRTIIEKQQEFYESERQE